MSGSKEVVDLNFGLGGTILTARVTEIELTASTLEASGDHGRLIIQHFAITAAKQCLIICSVSSCQQCSYVSQYDF
jgi:hypothetical protein